MGKPLIGRAILQQRVLKTERVDVPEWDGEILLRALSASETAEFAKFGQSQDAATDPSASLRLAAWVIVHSWVDEAGAPVLTVDDIPTLLDSNSTDVINNLGKRAMQISGLAPDALEDAKKNSESSQSNASGIPSP